VALVGLSGAVLDEAVRASRARADLDPPEDWGGYMQLDDGFAWDPAARAVTHVDHKPLELDRVYQIGVRRHKNDIVFNIACLHIPQTARRPATGVRREDW
jgi:hypothetical protein